MKLIALLIDAIGLSYFFWFHLLSLLRPVLLRLISKPDVAVVDCTSRETSANSDQLIDVDIRDLLASLPGAHDSLHSDLNINDDEETPLLSKCVCTAAPHNFLDF